MHEIDQELHKPSFSGEEGGECVEIAATGDGGRYLRNINDRSRPAHYFTEAEWYAFVLGVKNGEFD
jgi:hypothetical protein